MTFLLSVQRFANFTVFRLGPVTENFEQSLRVLPFRFYSLFLLTFQFELALYRTYDNIY